MLVARALLATLVFTIVTGLPAGAASWNPHTYAGASTLELRTTAAGEGEHWFPVWLVVIDDQVYVRLGPRAAGRIDRNTTAPWVGVRVGGQQFDRVKAALAPDYVERVAKAMADKYWSDVLIRHMSHPMTLRLVAAAEGE